ERQVLGRYLSLARAKAAILDPLYLLAPPANSSDLVAMGRALRALVSPIVEDAGAAPILLHHFPKSTPLGEVPTLRDLSGAGVGAWARSWLLVNREAEYDGAQVHRLLALIGTSTGDHSRLRITFDEKRWKITAKLCGDPEPAKRARRRTLFQNGEQHN